MFQQSQKMLTATKVRFWWDNDTGSGGSFCRGTERALTRLRSCEIFTSIYLIPRVQVGNYHCYSP